MFGGLLYVVYEEDYELFHTKPGYIPNASMLTTAGFDLVQQFYHATEIGDVANAVRVCSDQPQQTK